MHTIGIDIGGTQMRGAVVKRTGDVENLLAESIIENGTQQQVLQQLFGIVKRLMHTQVSAIGIGVPGLIDAARGIAYDVVNIPAWQEIELQKLVQQQFSIPVYINNDANCFALGEYCFGKGKNSNAMLGLTIGTGLGCGIIINGALYNGIHHGAGEFGTIDYLDRSFEYYASGQFFSNVYNMPGKTVFELAAGGQKTALDMYAEMGKHLGNAIKTMLYALDINLIVLGGSVSAAYPFFKETMWRQIETFAYKKTVQDLRIEVSTLQNAGISGAAACCW